MTNSNQKVGEISLGKNGLPTQNPRVDASVRFWVIFAVLTLSSFLLSYTSFTATAKWGIALLGVVTPLFLWFRWAETGQNQDPLFYQREFLPDNLLILVFLVLAGGLIRFWKFDSLFLWPLGDEGLNGSAALELSRHWSWRFFYTAGQAPPLPVWASALLLKMGFPPLTSLWLPSAIDSFLTLIAGYFAARQYFSKAFALLSCGLLAFSFWPVGMGRICHQGIWLPLWTCGCFYFLGLFLKKDQSENPWVAAILLGLVTGLGSFTFTPWPVVAIVIGIAVLGRTLRGGKWDWATFGCFGAGALVTLSPFLWAVMTEGYGRHLNEVSALNHGVDWGHTLSIMLGYGSVLGWGKFNQEGFYIAPWGGLLNPVLSSLFCLGLLQAYRTRSSAFGRWLLPIGFFLFLPGFLSSGVEGFRVAQALPWVMVITALGFQPLLEALPSRRWGTAIMAILIFSFLFDGVRLVLPFTDVAGHPDRFSMTGRSLARYRAFGILKEMESKAGPGIILGEWDLPADRTLEVATYPFNAAENPQLDTSQAQWLGVLTDAHYRPFLEKRFPGSRWIELDRDFSKDGNRILAIISMNRDSQELFQSWAKADPAFRDVNWAIDHIYEKNCLSYLNDKIREDYPLIKGDPFLESCYWEKVGQFYYLYGKHYPEHLKAMELAVQNGYPAAHLYAKWGELLLLGGDNRVYQEAMRKSHESEKLYPWRN